MKYKFADDSELEEYLEGCGKYCACLYVNNVLYVYNYIHEKAIKPSCNLSNG